MGREPDRGDRAVAGMYRLRAATAAAVPLDAVPPDPAPAAVPLQAADEPAEFAQLFDRYAAKLHRYVARRLGPTEADDLLGQTFLIAFERRHRYAGSADEALPWL